ncbi:DUF2790 domain-containing protein [Pseudomonas fluorescens]|uniref:DUF2790 domain-containing protein n=1 Tax=Pseudomonas fluorescens TaxID=294 RepID=A0A5E7DMF4_PSEFL|nr:DUF2790 domain-containing protein [Pseudomonas fluorescens]VVO18780.1 hypothetical protein PS833_04029 [Pseudomonas fluorescens]VVQ20080.1 hypothetical protein PS914_06412 [Pseudomonas fluorescens]
MKVLTFGMATLLATSPALADTHTTDPVIQDKTGFFVHLDVAKELTSTDITQACGIVPARFTYLDPQGREHVLDYQAQGVWCISDH